MRSWVESRRRAKEERPAPPSRPQSTNATVVPLSARAGDDAQKLKEIKKEDAVRPALKALISAVQGVGAPLRGAVAEVAAGLAQRGRAVSSVEQAKAFALLIQQATKIARTTAQSIGVQAADTAQSFALVEAVSDMAGAYYRASGVLQPSPLVGQIVASITQIAQEGAAREDLIPGVGKTTQARVALDLLKAMPPVVHAVSRYSYGRPPLVLITEVAMELQFMAAEATRGLVPVGASLEEWHAVHAAMLHTAGQLYAESHFAVAENEQAMSGIAAPAGEVPMEQVWASLEGTLGQISTFAGHLAGTASLAVGQRGSASGGGAITDASSSIDRPSGAPVGAAASVSVPY